MAEDTDVLIIGGGLAGLTSAVGLSREGLKVTVVERSDNLGGRAQSWTDGALGERIDIGPHILITQYRNMLKLLDELGTRDRVVWQQKPHLILVDKPRPVVMRLRPLSAPLHFAPSMLTVPQVSWGDLLSNRRALWEILRLDEERILELDKIDAAHHLRQLGVSQRAMDWFWRSAGMTVLNTPLEECSTGALFRFLRYLVGRNDYRVGFAGSALGDLFTSGAVDRVTAAGGEVRLRTRVEELTADGETLTGARLQGGRNIRASVCVAALPPRDLLAILPLAWIERHKVFSDLETFKPSPYICTYLWFERKLTDELFWTKVWAPDNLNYDFYDLSNIKPERAGKPSLIASNCMYSQRSAALSDEEIIRQTVAEVAEYLPEAATTPVLNARVHRIPMGIVKPFPGSERRRPDPVTPIAGLYLAGDWINTGLPSSMESAARSGWMAAERVLGAAGKPCDLVQPLPGLTGLARVLGK